MIEDAIGWILAADEDDVVGRLWELTEVAPSTVSDIVTHLKNKKVDVICYESVADAIVNSPLCRARAAELFSCLAMACAGTASAHFVEDPEGVWVFQP